LYRPDGVGSGALLCVVTQSSARVHAARYAAAAPVVRYRASSCSIALGWPLGPRVGNAHVSTVSEFTDSYSTGTDLPFRAR